MTDAPSHGKSLAQLLAAAMQPGGAACPDAAILAAYQDHSLSAEEVEQWETHLAGCLRCQQILSVLAVSGEQALAPEEVQRLGKLVADSASGRSTVTELPSRRSAPQAARWPWLVTAAAIAASFALWFALKPAPPSAGVLTAENRPMIAEPAEPQIAAPQSTAPEAPRQNSQNAPAQSEDTSPARARTPSARPNESARLPLNYAAPPSPSDALQKEAAPETPRATIANSQEAGAALSAQPQPRSQDQASASSPAPAPAPATPPEFQAKTAAPSKALSANRSALIPQNPALAGAPLDQRQIEFASAGSTVLWRAGEGGAIQRSTDNGVTWTAQASGVATQLLAGASPSSNVAWIVGRAGVILRTLNGQTWQRLAAPADASRADFVAIEATDGLHATVTTADGRRFATADGGVSWTPIP